MRQMSDKKAEEALLPLATKMHNVYWTKTDK